MPFWPGANVSFPAVPMTVSSSVESPRLIAISISGRLNSEVKPGPRKPSDMSTVKLSAAPGAPRTWIESVFVVVAAPQAAGTNPKRSSPFAATLSVASEPSATRAVTAWVPAS